MGFEYEMGLFPTIQEEAKSKGIRLLYKQIPILGDQLTFGNLLVSFIVDEELANYKTIHDWMVGIGFPKSRQQFIDFRRSQSNTPQA